MVAAAAVVVVVVASGEVNSSFPVAWRSNDLRHTISHILKKAIKVISSLA